jgi:PAS domain S-box-containing protein
MNRDGQGKRVRKPRGAPGIGSDASTRQADVIDHIPVAIAIICAEDLAVRRVNPAWAELLGIAPDDAVGKHLSEILGPTDDSLFDLIRAARESRSDFRVSNVQLRDCGNRVFGLHVVPRSRSSRRPVEQLVLVLNEDTERRQLMRAADAAAEAERRRADELDAVFASIADAVVLADSAGKVRKHNAAAAALFDLRDASGLGIDAPELELRRTTSEPIAPHDAPLARALRMESVQREEAVVVRPGRPRRVVSASAAPVMSGPVVTGAVAVFHDIGDLLGAGRRLTRALRAERRRAHEARSLYDAWRAVSSGLSLRERLDVVAKTMADAVGVGRCYLLLLDGSLLRPAAAFGLSPEARQGFDRTTVALRRIGAATRRAIEARRAQDVGDARSELPEDWRLACARDLKSALVVPLVYGNRVSGIAYLDEPDVRRRFREQDRSLATAISGQGAIAIENARLYEAEQDRARMLEAMMAELNHRVKNNLAVISGLLALQLTQSDPAATRESVLRDCITRIQSLSLIHQVLHDEDLDAVEIKETTRRLGEMVCDAFGGPGRKISFRVRGDRLMLPCKIGTSLGLAINELICNAIKHGFAGRAQGRIVVTIRVGEQIRISVRDDGCGLPPDYDPARNGHVGTLITRTLIEGELGGSFILRNNPRGGVTALLVFPPPLAART